jgi:hypothetical protein
LTTVLAAAGSSIRKSKALPVPRRNKDFKEQYEVLKKKRMIRVQLYGSTSHIAFSTSMFRSRLLKKFSHE